MDEPDKKPLKADDIEALLRAARDVELSSRADFVSDEPLGPGDVQYLRNMPEDNLTVTRPAGIDPGWRSTAASADELLRQAEDHLAEALASEKESAPSGPLMPFPSARPQPRTASPGLPLSLIGDLDLDVTLEIGRAELKIEELMALREGSVVPLDKRAGEPINILANGTLIARGEVVVVNDKFCVRISEIVGQSPQ